MPPYYNSGVVMAPWSLDLGRLWKEHIGRIVGALDGEPAPAGTKWVRHSDQHGLATAAEALRNAGARVVTLALPYQARPPLLIAGVLPWAEVALFHYVKAFRPHGESVAEVRRLLYGRRFAPARRWPAGSVCGPSGLLSFVWSSRRACWPTRGSSITCIRSFGNSACRRRPGVGSNANRQVQRR